MNQYQNWIEYRNKIKAVRMSAKLNFNQIETEHSPILYRTITTAFIPDKRHLLEGGNRRPYFMVMDHDTSNKQGRYYRLEQVPEYARNFHDTVLNKHLNNLYSRNIFDPTTFIVGIRTPEHLQNYHDRNNFEAVESLANNVYHINNEQDPEVIGRQHLPDVIGRHISNILPKPNIAEDYAIEKMYPEGTDIRSIRRHLEIISGDILRKAYNDYLNTSPKHSSNEPMSFQRYIRTYQLPESHSHPLSRIILNQIKDIYDPRHTNKH